MCFVKSSKPQAVVEPVEPVVRQKADASLTKNTKNEAKNIEGYRENIKTSPIGLEDNATTSKKTLLGE